jgi:hypothetical protein
MADLDYGTGFQNTNSSPFVNYSNDRAVVGNNAGELCMIKNVFGGVPTLVGVAEGWPSSGCVTLAGTLTGPVWDGTSNRIFVGSSNGNLYGIDATNGNQIAGSPWSIVTTGPGIVDAPMGARHRDST